MPQRHDTSSQEASSSAPLASHGLVKTKGPPVSNEEWDRFITSYTMGDLSSYEFVDSSAAPPNMGEMATRHHETDDPLRTTDVSPTQPSASASHSLASDKPIRSSIPRAMESESSIEPPESSSPSDNDCEKSRAQADVSSSGPANQDPDIPNIEGSETVDNYENRKAGHLSETGAKSKDYQQSAMTLENMSKLGHEQRKETMKSGNSSDKRKEAKGNRGERDKVALRGAADDDTSSSEPEPTEAQRRKRPRRPRSRGSWTRRTTSPSGSIFRPDRRSSLDNALFESGTNTSSSISQAELDYDYAAERVRVKEFFEKNGYLCAPRQTTGIMRRRLRVIRRLGLEQPETYLCDTLDRLTRLAQSFFKTPYAVISVIGKSKQVFLSKIGFELRTSGLDDSLCSHAMMLHNAGDKCFVINDAAKDWRFKKNPLIQEGHGKFRFYAGSPLNVGHGSNEVAIGVLCILDDKPREFSADDRALLADLASCVVSELELLYSQQASLESSKLHQISVDFLRRSLKHRPLERAGNSSRSGTHSSDSHSSSSSAKISSGRKRIEGADASQSSGGDIYDEACREIRDALNAYAVAVVDLSQFHLFYPTYQNTSTAGGSTRVGTHSASGQGGSVGTARAGASSTVRQGSTTSTQGGEADEGDGYSWDSRKRRARQTWSEKDPLAPSRAPQVLFIPSGPRSSWRRTKVRRGNSEANVDNLDVLGYSCAKDGFAFNFTSSPAARKIIAEFIASNVGSRKVWYTRDDSEGIAQSINHLMPPGTETSLALPVFGFDGQVAFAVVACWTDPLYTYPAGAMQFVETIAGSLLASVLKERLHQAERAQLNFASAASHELRTPLHQMNAAASLLRSFLNPILESTSSPQPNFSISPDDRSEILAQMEIIESNGISLGGILENIIDTLDIGKMALKVDDPSALPATDKLNATKKDSDGNVVSLSEVLEKIVDDAMELESKTRRVTNAKGLNDVEVILEVLPRNRGGWLMSQDPGPFSRALGKVVHNAIKFTDKGHVHITVEDISREVILPGGYDNTMKVSTVSIDIKDTGRGMSADFLDREVLRPFTKEDPFTPGAGLGLGLAQRMIELVGGKLAIASSPAKGTLVHVEVPIRLLNDDNDSDQDNLGRNDATSSDGGQSPSNVRQDGIYLAGWGNSKDPAIGRVGKCLARQLKLHLCRVVPEISYASLIVMPEGGVSDAKLTKLCRSARPGVQVIVLDKDRSKYGQADSQSPIHAYTNPDRSSGTSRTAPRASTFASEEEQEYLKTVPISYLSRPLRPSVIRRIIKPVLQPPMEQEIYKSDVVGGDEARSEAQRDQTASPLETRTAYTRSSTDAMSSQSSQSVTPSPETNRDETKSEDEGRSGGEYQGSSMSDMSVWTSDNSESRPGMAYTAANAQNTAHGGPNSERPLKVLVVEDNVVNRRILTTMLRRAACHYVEASDGMEAVDQFLTFQPHLVLLDITMPRKDGFAAAAEMRQLEITRRRAERDPQETTKTGDVESAMSALSVDAEHPVTSTGAFGLDSDESARFQRAKIIAVTAMSAEHQKRRGLYECGIDHWMTKPLSMSVLRSMVEKMKAEIQQGAAGKLPLLDMLYSTKNVG